MTSLECLECSGKTGFYAETGTRLFLVTNDILRMPKNIFDWTNVHFVYNVSRPSSSNSTARIISLWMFIQNFTTLIDPHPSVFPRILNPLLSSDVVPYSCSNKLRLSSASCCRKMNKIEIKWTKNRKMGRGGGGLL